MDVQEWECRYLALKKLEQERKNTRNITILIIAIIAFIITIFFGTLGYIAIFGLSWIDAFYNAVLILTAIDIANQPISTGQKLFIIIYALISVILLLSIINAGVQRLADSFVNADNLSNI